MQVPCQTDFSHQKRFGQLARVLLLLSCQAFAADQNKAAADISRYLPLAFLDPNIKQDILNGTQPATLTLEAIRQLGKVPADFESQHSLLGY